MSSCYKKKSTQCQKLTNKTHGDERKKNKTNKSDFPKKNSHDPRNDFLVITEQGANIAFAIRKISPHIMALEKRDERR